MDIDTNANQYMLSIAIPGFSSYEVIEINSIIDLGDCINVVWGDNELFMDKDNMVVSNKSVIWKKGDLEVYIDRLDGEDICPSFAA